MSATAEILDAYRAASRRRRGVLGALGAAVAVVALLSVALGYSGEGMLDSARAFLAAAWSWLVPAERADLDPTARALWEIRAPRAFAAMMSGAALAVAGSLTQTTLRNPLASPYTLGISSAASFGAAVALITSGGVPGLDRLPGDYSLIAHAFVFAAICTAAIHLLAKARQVTPETVILSGVAMMFFFTALTSLVQYVADPDDVAQLVYWMFGSLQRATWSKFWIITVVTVVAVGLARRWVWDLNALGSGDEAAGSVGVDVQSRRLRCLALASLVTAVVVAMFGPIAFVGLVAPHLARMIVGGDHRDLLPATCLVGALLLMVADVVARNVISPAVIPVGIITSFVGVPMLMYLMLRGRSGHW